MILKTVTGRKNWCLTIFRLDELESALCHPQFSQKVSYFVYQKEKCPRTKRLHYQAYLQGSTRLRFTELKALFPTAWFKPQRASDSDKAREYCMKSDTQVEPPVEHGVYVQTKVGSRFDLRDVYDACLEGKSEMYLWENHTSSMFRYGKRIDYLRDFGTVGLLPGMPICGPKETVVTLLLGPSRTGKTYYFYENTPMTHRYVVPVQSGRSIWFNGLEPHHTDILFDDFKGNVGLMQLLQLLDNYIQKVEKKHGHTYLCATNIWITSNYHPLLWYDYSTRQESYTALINRIDRCLVFSPLSGGRTHAFLPPVLTPMEDVPEPIHGFHRQSTNYNLGPAASGG